MSETHVPHIALTPVTSSQVAAVGYDKASKTLAVTFTRGTGAEYRYPNVEAKTHADFMAADSKGGFFGKHIKPLPFTKLAPVPNAEADEKAPAASTPEQA